MKEQVNTENILLEISLENICSGLCEKLSFVLWNVICVQMAKFAYMFFDES